MGIWFWISYLSILIFAFLLSARVEKWLTKRKKPQKTVITIGSLLFVAMANAIDCAYKISQKPQMWLKYILLYVIMIAVGTYILTIFRLWLIKKNEEDKKDE